MYPYFEHSLIDYFVILKQFPSSSFKGKYLKPAHTFQCPNKTRIVRNKNAELLSFGSLWIRIQVRAITISQESSEEAIFERSSKLDGDLLDEEVFISQLYRRAKLLNNEFQAKVSQLLPICIFLNTS